MCCNITISVEDIIMDLSILFSQSLKRARQEGAYTNVRNRQNFVQFYILFHIKDHQ